MKKLLLVPVAALLMSFSANAQSIKTLTISEHQRSSDEEFRDALVEVRGHRSPGAVIATDALYGGIAGLAVGAGVALIANDGNWGRDLAVGAGVGLIAGGIYGAVDVSTYRDGYHDKGPNFGSSYKVGGKF